jgi:hypothetical protein
MPSAAIAPAAPGAVEMMPGFDVDILLAIPQGAVVAVVPQTPSAMLRLVR